MNTCTELAMTSFFFIIAGMYMLFVAYLMWYHNNLKGAKKYSIIGIILSTISNALLLFAVLSSGAVLNQILTIGWLIGLFIVVVLSLTIVYKMKLRE